MQEADATKIRRTMCQPGRTDRERAFSIAHETATNHTDRPSMLGRPPKLIREHEDSFPSITPGVKRKTRMN